MKHMLENSEILRFSRHLLLPEIGIDGNYLYFINYGTKGQQDLKNGNVVVIGAGGLGCPIILYLSSAGLGNLTIIDEDVVSIENLHRQILYTDEDVGQPKVLVAQKLAKKRNSNINCRALVTRISWNNAIDILFANDETYNVIIDATDNFETRYLINDISLYKNIPWVYGSALAFEGHMATFNCTINDNNSLCYRCLFPEPPPQNTLMGCNEKGVFGVIPGIIGLNQALEAQKIIIQTLTPSYTNKMLIFDALSTGSCFKEIKIRTKKSNCISCSVIPISNLTPSQFKLLGSQILEAVSFCPSNMLNVNSISVLEMKNLWSTMFHREICILDVRELHELKICKIPCPDTIKLLYVPFSKITRQKGIENLEDELESFYNSLIPGKSSDQLTVLVICRRGKDSKLTVEMLSQRPKFKEFNGIVLYNITGGLHSWHHTVDPNYPLY